MTTVTLVIILTYYIKLFIIAILGFSEKWIKSTESLSGQNTIVINWITLESYFKWFVVGYFTIVTAIVFTIL